MTGYNPGMNTVPILFAPTERFALKVNEAVHIILDFFAQCPLIRDIKEDDRKLLSAHSYLSVWMVSTW